MYREDTSDQVEKVYYHFEHDKNDPLTLVWLKNIDKMNYLDSRMENTFPNSIVLPEPKKSSMLKSSIMAMVNQPVAASIMIRQFC